MYDDCARRAPPPPFESFEPSEPSHRRRVQWHSRIGGGERSEPVSRMVILPYDTESKSRNVLASPLGEEGHEVAKGCTRVRMIMILDVDVTAERRHYNTHRPLKGKRLTTFCASLALLHPLLSLTHWIFKSLMLPYKSSSHSEKCVRCAPLRSGGRRLAVRTVMENPIGALLCTPFAASRDFPSRGNEKYGGEKQRVIYFMYHSAVSLFGGERSEPIRRMPIMPYDTER